MKRAMISQPMRGLSEDEIRTRRDKAVQVLQNKGYAVTDALAPEAVREECSILKFACNEPLFLLCCSLGMMAYCNTVYFLDGWQSARGCRIEHDAAEAYGLELLYENGGKDTFT